MARRIGTYITDRRIEGSTAFLAHSLRGGNGPDDERERTSLLPRTAERHADSSSASAASAASAASPQEEGKERRLLLAERPPPPAIAAPRPLASPPPPRGWSEPAASLAASLEAWLAAKGSALALLPLLPSATQRVSTTSAGCETSAPATPAIAPQKADTKSEGRSACR